MNLRMFVARHWKPIVIAIQIGLFALLLVAVGRAHAEPIDTPVGP